jgi:DNA-binding MarR family transcriptional regulator
VNQELPLLPYAGTSGWSGSDTSRERARQQDSDGTTANRQTLTLRIIWDEAQYDGITWAELSEKTGWHHGSASGVLSVLHKEGLIERLKGSKRNKCAIYVSPVHVNGREITEPKVRCCKHCGREL